MSALIEVEFMKKAYGLLYRLENTLRTFIKATMEKTYGADWIIKAPLSMKYPPIKKNYSSFHYHEFISLLTGYPCLKTLFRDHTIIAFQTTISIRNKIAHSQVITQDEYKHLLSTYEQLINSISKQEID